MSESNQTSESSGCFGCLYYAAALIVAGLLYLIPTAGPYLALVVLVGAFVVERIASRGRTETAARTTGGATAPAADGGTVSTPQRAAKATRPTIRLSSSGRRSVVGEYYHAAEIATFVGRRILARAGDWDAGLRATAYLRREPGNRHDRNAVRVLLPHRGGVMLHAGYIAASEAPRWQPLLRKIEKAGRIAECCAMIYRDARDDGYQIVLRLADPEDAELANAEPDDATFLPAERQCAVTGEKEHQDVLEPYRDGALVWATLHRATVPRGKYAGSETIEVRIDGSPVGLLTAAQGERYAEVLTWGEVVACEARIYQGANYLEVQLMLPKVD